MLILNFTHPLTDEHCKQIEELAGTPMFSDNDTGSPPN